MLIARFLGVAIALGFLQAGVVRAYQMMPPPMPDLDWHGRPIELGPIIDIAHPARAETPPAELPAVEAADPAAEVEDAAEPETAEMTAEEAE